MTHRLFISDLHLDASRPDLTDAFHQFLAGNAPDCDELFILGDFFEVWLGDDDDSKFSTNIIETLSKLNCQTFIMHGNRDFLIGSKFCDAADVTLLSDPSIIQLGDRPALLMHGDSLCTADTEYMKARATLRSKAFQADFLSKGLKERAAFANQMRGESKNHTRETAADIMDVTPSAVEDAFISAGVDLLIHGHTHRPNHHKVELAGQTENTQTTDTGPALSHADRFVLGDWHTSMQYLEAIDDRLTLKTYHF